MAGEGEGGSSVVYSRTKRSTEAYSGEAFARGESRKLDKVVLKSIGTVRGQCGE